MNNWKTTLTGSLAAIFAALAAYDLNALTGKSLAAIVLGALFAYFAKDHDGPPSPGRVLEGRAPFLLLALACLPAF